MFYDAETGELITPEQAREAFAQGRLGVSGGEPIVVRDASGNRIEVSAGENMGADLGRYLSQGFEIETPDQTQRTAETIEARNSPLLAAGEAAVNAATLGLSDFAGAQLLGEDYARRANVRRESLGGIATGIDAGVTLGAAALTGGTSLLARAAAATPTGMLARGALSAGSALEASLLARGAGAGTARVAAMAAEGALDGAVAGVGAQLSESSLGNRELVAEELLASGGLGALIGGGAGGIFGLGSAAIGSRARAIADRRAAEAGAPVAARGEREAGQWSAIPYDPDAPSAPTGSAAVAPANVSSAIPEKVSEFSARIGEKTIGGGDLIRNVGKDASVRADIIDPDRARQELAKKATDHLQASFDIEHLSRSFAAGKIKSKQLSRDVLESTDVHPDIEREVSRIMSEYEANLDDLIESDLLSKSNAARYKRDVELIKKTMSENIGPERGKKASNKRVFVALENLKRVADNRRKTLKGSGVELAAQEAMPQLRAIATQLGEGLRKTLESERLWGAAGKRQRIHNSALSDMLGNSKEFDQTFAYRTGEGVSPEFWDIEKRVADGEGIERFLKMMENPAQEFRVEQAMRHLRSREKYLDTLITNDMVPASYAADFEAARAGMRQTIATFEEARERLGKIGSWDALRQAEKELGEGVSAMGAPGKLLSAVGAATGVTRPISMMDNAMRIEAMAQRSREVREKITTEAASAVKELAEPPKKRRQSRALRQASRAASRVVSRTAIAEQRRAERDRGMRVERAFTELAQNPMPLIDAMSYQTNDIAGVAPGVTLEMNMGVARAMEFLRSKMPPETSSPNLLQPQANRRYWDPATTDSYRDYMAVISDPTKALRDLRDGTLSRASVEALRAVYPSIYETMRAEVAMQISKQRDEMPFDSLVQLSILMDLPGHPSLSTDYQSTLADARAAGSSESPSSTGGEARVSPSNIKPLEVNKGYFNNISEGLSKS